MKAQEPSNSATLPGLRASWKPVPLSPLYAVQLIAVSVVALAIPAIYIALVAAAGWGLYRYVAWFVERLSMPSSRGSLVNSVLLASPILVGLILVFFLLKPLIIPRAKQPEPVRLPVSHEPRLHAFVTQLCHTINAPVPKWIEVDTNVNASASFTHGLWSVLLPTPQMTLTIGLPLIHGMTVQQFTGILVHELGHFNQGLGMRTSYVIQRINSWLAGRVYGRDALDVLLQMFAHHESPPLLRGLAWVVVAVVWLTRRVLWVLLMIAGALTFAFARQMEYDADYAETRFIGSASYAQSTRQLQLLHAAHAQSARRVREYLRAKELPDDLPALVAEAAGELGPDDLAKVEEQLADRKTKWYDSHPPDALRLEKAARRNEPGIFHNDDPASSLFDNLDIASKRATASFWEVELGRRIVAKAKSASSAQAVAQGRQNQSRRDAVVSVLGFDPPLWRPLLLTMRELRPSEDLKRDAQRLKEARRALRERHAAAKGVDVAFAKADRELHEFVAARSALEHGASAREIKEAWEFETGGRQHATDAIAIRRDRCAEAAGTLDELLDLGALRISATLRILAHKACDGRVANVEKLRERARMLLEAHAAMKSALSSASDLRPTVAEAEGMVLVHSRSTKDRDRLRAPLNRLAERTHGALSDIRSKCGAAEDPYPPPGEIRSLGGRIVPDLPPAGLTPAAVMVAIEVVQEYPRELRRITAELVEIASEVERTFSGETAKAG